MIFKINTIKISAYIDDIRIRVTLCFQANHMFTNMASSSGASSANENAQAVAPTPTPVEGELTDIIRQCVREEIEIQRNVRPISTIMHRT